MCATFLLKRIALMKYEQKSIFENRYPYFDVMRGVLRAFCVQRKTRRYARAYSETYPYARTAEVLRSKKRLRIRRGHRNNLSLASDERLKTRLRHSARKLRRKQKISRAVPFARYELHSQELA